MKWVNLAVLLILGGMAITVVADDKKTKRTPKEALQAFNDLIGEWKGTGTPEGTQEKKNKEFWVESFKWRWQFKGEDAWLQASFEKGKYLARAELRYLPDKDQYQMTVVTPAKESRTFTGTFQAKDKRLILRRRDAAAKQDQQLVISLLHSNRFLYSFEAKPQDRTLYSRVYRVGCTKKGVAFAAGDDQPECVVSGGLGTTKVIYKGRTYYVCCSGCLAEFKVNPDKYVKEYEAKKAKKAGEKE
jgi:hypothetical protein